MFSATLMLIGNLVCVLAKFPKRSAARENLKRSAARENLKEGVICTTYENNVYICTMITYILFFSLCRFRNKIKH